MKDSGTVWSWWNAARRGNATSVNNAKRYALPAHSTTQRVSRSCCCTNVRRSFAKPRSVVVVLRRCHTALPVVRAPTPRSMRSGLNGYVTTASSGFVNGCGRCCYCYHYCGCGCCYCCGCCICLFTFGYWRPYPGSTHAPFGSLLLPGVSQTRPYS